MGPDASPWLSDTATSSLVQVLASSIYPALAARDSPSDSAHSSAVRLSEITRRGARSVVQLERALVGLGGATHGVWTLIQWHFTATLWMGGAGASGRRRLRWARPIRCPSRSAPVVPFGAARWPETFVACIRRTRPLVLLRINPSQRGAARYTSVVAAFRPWLASYTDMEAPEGHKTLRHFAGRGLVETTTRRRLHQVAL